MSKLVDTVLYAVCVTAGYLMSYWNRPFFPEWCSDYNLDDSTVYDTMMRIAGSWAGVAKTFKVVADMYGWTHIVLLSDDETGQVCWYGSSTFERVFGNNENYTFTWLRFGSDPTDEKMDEIIDQIQALTRGFYRIIYLFTFTQTTSLNVEQ